MTEQADLDDEEAGGRAVVKTKGTDEEVADVGPDPDVSDGRGAPEFCTAETGGCGCNGISGFERIEAEAELTDAIGAASDTEFDPGAVV